MTLPGSRFQLSPSHNHCQLHAKVPELLGATENGLYNACSADSEGKWLSCQMQNILRYAMCTIAVIKRAFMIKCTNVHPCAMGIHVHVHLL